MIEPLIKDLLASVVVFGLAWAFFILGHIIASQLRIVQGVGLPVVVLALLAGLGAGLFSWIFFKAWFSAVETHAFASIVTPVAYLGFCGLYILIGPVTVDRSFTLMILNELEDKTKGLSVETLRASMTGDRILQKRLRELESAGAISVRDAVYITPHGIRVLGWYRRLGAAFSIKFQ